MVLVCNINIRKTKVRKKKIVSIVQKKKNELKWFFGDINKKINFIVNSTMK